MKKLSIVFDFGGVLLDWNPRYLYRKLFNGDERSMDRFLQEIDFFAWNLQQDAGRPFDRALAEACQEHPQYCELIRAYDERYLETIGGQIDGSVKILYDLKRAGYPLYGLSNWPLDKYQRVRPYFAFFDCFDMILVSGEVQIIKPDPRIFQLLLERTARKPGECLLIDDSEANVQAASEMGFQTIHFCSPEQVENDLRALGV